MDRRERRYRDEIRSIEKQLPLFKQKIAELESRRGELSGITVSQEPAKIPADPPYERYSYRYAQLLPPRPETSAKVEVKSEPETGTAPAGSPLAFLSRDNVVGVLGEANQKLRTLHQVVNRAAVSMEFILFIINFLSQENPNLQHLMTIAEAVQQKDADPAADSQIDEQTPSVTSRINLTPETVSEIMKSPLFQQLAAGLTQEKQPE